VVAPAGALARDVAGVRELGDDPMGGPFGDPDALADVAKASARITSDADQPLSVLVRDVQPAPVFSAIDISISFLEGYFML
jgi:hypothetical protein